MTPATKPLRLYTLPELEELTGVSRDTLDREIRDGRLKATRVRSRVFIRQENLESWVFACEEASDTPSTICRVPSRFRIVSKEERLAQARELRVRARGLAGEPGR